MPAHGLVGVLEADGELLDRGVLAGRVDDRGGAADEVGKRDLVWLHGQVLPAQNSITLRMPSWSCISSKPWLTSSSVIRCEMNGSTSMSPSR